MKTLMLALLMLLPVLASAQTHRASLRGIVTDPSTAVVVGAEVTVTNIDTNDSRTTVSDAEGAFALSSLAAGNYKIQVASPGFLTYSYEPLALTVNQELRVERYTHCCGT